MILDGRYVKAKIYSRQEHRVIRAIGFGRATHDNSGCQGYKPTTIKGQNSNHYNQEIVDIVTHGRVCH